LANLNESLADELSQPIGFPTAHSSKKIPKLNKAQNPIKPSGLGFFKNLGFSGTSQAHRKSG